jgi:hypothetical protein
LSDERADLILDMLRAIRAEQAARREKLDEIINRSVLSNARSPL